MSKMKRFTLIELLVVIGIIALLASLLFPALAKAKGSAVNIGCKNNLKQIGVAFYSYSVDNAEFLPRGDNGWTAQIWCTQAGDSPLAPAYIPDNMIYGGNDIIGYSGRACPAAEGMWEYAINYYVGYPATGNLRLSKIKAPSETFLVTDYWGIWYEVPGAESATAMKRWRHGMACNYLFCDGHVASVAFNATPWLYSTPLWINTGGSW